MNPIQAMKVCTLSSKMIRGCNPTFSAESCQDEWLLMSILDYYRVNTSNLYPNPTKYWRFVFDMKWGWEYSKTDFKTHSMKEYILLSKLIETKKRQIKFHLYCLIRMFSKYIHTKPIPNMIMNYLYLPTLKSIIRTELNSNYPPTRLPNIHPVNPLQVFFGRCYQYGFIHPETTQCYIKGWVQFSTLVNTCKLIPRPHIQHPDLIIQTKKSFFYLLHLISKEDDKQYTTPNHSHMYQACHYNFSGQDNTKYHILVSFENSHWKKKSIMDIWVSDLFGW